ncbi:unnamed protein product, partial [Mesorhabditis belari]|uniref:FYVE-type domain-containing protein n=1 Tax=Mesorhabditis belari TaxID=2138241 RepID=A0AAF3J9Q2_9BILA
MEDGPSVIQQGFLCPFCMTDLGSYIALANHVESAHPEDADTPAFEQIRGFIDKAKRSFKRFEPGIDIENLREKVGNIATSASAGNILQSESLQRSVEPLRKTRSKSREREVKPTKVKPIEIIHVRPEIGVKRSHTDYFLRCREASVNDIAVRTNTLIIRMDKLINEAPQEHSKRKDFERFVVPWSEDSESSACPGCNQKFSLTRRRHHCRLCGKVLCEKCSRFLSFLTARKLTNPALAAAMTEEKQNASTQKAEVRSLDKLADLAQRTGGHLRGLIGGSKSNDGSEDAAEHLRVCVPCLTLLERREQQMEARNPPAMVSLYERLVGLLSEMSKLTPSYSRMALSINNGEAIYTLQAAEELRRRIAERQREVDVLSKTIENEGGEGLPFREQQLRKNIRFVSVQTLHNFISNMPNLPSSEKYAELAEEHRNKVAKQVEEARLQAQRAVSNIKIPSVPIVETKPSSSFMGRVVEDGWTPDFSPITNPFAEEEDRQHPLQEQRGILRGYLSQAAAVGRLEEVEILERNLRDLEAEMRQLGLNFD